MSNETSRRISRLNDLFRASIVKPNSEQKLGQVFCTANIMSLPKEEVNTIVERVSTYSDFDESNDPYGEHDFGSFSFRSDKVYWKIDYKNPNLEYQPEYTPDPKDPNRILTILFSYEW